MCRKDQYISGLLALYKAGALRGLGKMVINKTPSDDFLPQL